MFKIVKITQGLIYFLSWYTSILAGYMLFVPLAILQIATPEAHRSTVDIIVNYWQYYVTTLLVRKNCEIHVTGDPILSDETTILISNHRTRVDWNFLWGVTYHAIEGKDRWRYSTKFVLKDSIKKIPVIGWVMQMALYVFIKRNWEEDKQRFDDYIEYVQDMKYNHLLILFPEGTDLTEKTKMTSDKFAIKNGFPRYKHVLHPRCTGFVYLVNQMRKRKCLDAVYDLTLIYPDGCPQTEGDLFFGNFPKKVFAHLVRYPVSDLPKSEDGLKKFVEKRWLEKEKTIEEFATSGNFLCYGRELNRQNSLPWAYFTQILWVGLTLVMIKLAIINKTYLYFILIYSVSFYLFPLLTMYRLKKNVNQIFSKVAELL